MNIGGLNRKTITVEIAGDKYDISFVSVYARELAKKFYQSMVDSLETLATGDDDKAEEIRDKVERDIIAVRYELIQHILESNGYEFDRDKWDKNTDWADHNEFVQQCMAKDDREDKKKEEQSKT